jgi:hypothetical protein
VRRTVTGYAFLVGAILCFALFSWYPMIHEILLSFQHLNLVGQSEGYDGWRNYEHMLNDPDFWTSVHVTLVFTGLALIFGYAVPFVIAVALNEFRHAKSYFRLLVYLPVMLPPVAGAFLWRNWFYAPDGSGLFNEVLHDLHLPTSTWLQSLEQHLRHPVPGDLLHLEQHGQRCADLPRRAAGRARRAVRGGRARRRGDRQADLARDHPADPADPLADAAAAGRQHHADLHSSPTCSPAARTAPERGLSDLPGRVQLQQLRRPRRSARSCCCLGLFSGAVSQAPGSGRRTSAWPLSMCRPEP